MKIVAEVDPVGILLGKNYAGCTMGGVCQQKVQRVLAAGEALNGNVLTVWQPLHPGYVDVCVFAQIDLNRRTCGSGLYEEMHRGNGLAGHGISDELLIAIRLAQGVFIDGTIICFYPGN